MIDTNVVSELMRPSPVAAVQRWIDVNWPFPASSAGVGYGLAGATITDRLDFLFPAATGIRCGPSPSGSGICASERRAWPPAPFSRGACAIGSPSSVMGEARRRPL